MKVFILIRDNDNGTWLHAFSTYDLAMAALQMHLDNDSDIEWLVEDRGLKGFTAQEYLDGALYDYPSFHIRNYYRIDELEVDDGIGAKESL